MVILAQGSVSSFLYLALACITILAGIPTTTWVGTQITKIAGKVTTIRKASTLMTKQKSLHPLPSSCTDLLGELFHGMPSVLCQNF